VPVNEPGESTILSNLLLTSDLKGYVENPNYYFLNDNKDTRANLDLLMLTQGYRRFVWKQVLNNSYPANARQPQKGISLSGLINDMSGKPVPNAKVSLLTKNAGVALSDTTADATGHFVLKI
jgi:hypothetical protein